MYTDDTLMRRK